MCGDKECGPFRVYEISDIKPGKWWFSDNSRPNHQPPENDADTYPVTEEGDSQLGSERMANEAKAKFALGLTRRWGTPRALSDECGENCRCVRTEEQIGQPSVTEERSWRQPMSLDHHPDIVVMGTYKIRFTDYKGKCDSGDQVGEPISWDGGGIEQVAKKPRKKAKKTV